MLARSDRPTAIFAASDTQALGVLAAAQDLGLHVPDDLSVIGYDDIEACDFVGLTTVRQHLFESGRQGARCSWPRSWSALRHPVVVIPPEICPTTHDGAPKGGPPPRVTDRTRALSIADPWRRTQMFSTNPDGRWPEAASFAVLGSGRRPGHPGRRVRARRLGRTVSLDRTVRRSAPPGGVARAQQSAVGERGGGCPTAGPIRSC